MNIFSIQFKLLNIWLLNSDANSDARLIANMSTTFK